MEGSSKYFKEYQTHGYDLGKRNTLKENIKYSQQHLSLIQTLPNSSTQCPPKPHKNNAIAT